MKLILSFLLLLSLCVSKTLEAKEIRQVYYPNGQLQFEYEIEGVVFDGAFYSYYGDGKQQMTGQFNKNQKVGTWKFWDRRGLLRSERNYTNNSKFTIVKQWHPDGTAMSSGDIEEYNRQLFHVTATNPKGVETIYANRFMVRLDVESHSELLGKEGLADQLMQQALNGHILAFIEQRFVYPIREKSQLEKLLKEKPTQMIIKEEHYWSASKQTMLYKVLGIGLIKEENGSRKDICWFYAPDVEKLAPGAMVTKLLNHEYQQVVESSTIKASGYENTRNEKIALRILEQEALVLIYFLTPQTRQHQEVSR